MALSMNQFRGGNGGNRCSGIKICRSLGSVASLFSIKPGRPRFRVTDPPPFYDRPANDRVTYALTSFHQHSPHPGDRIADSEIFPSPRGDRCTPISPFNRNKVLNIFFARPLYLEFAKIREYVADRSSETKRGWKKEIVRFIDCALRIDEFRRISQERRRERERERDSGDGAITGESGPDENKNRV